MKKAAIVALLLVFGVFSAANAQKIPNDTGTNTAIDCDVTGYKSYERTGSWAIPDANPAGVLIGPLQTESDGTTIADVIVDISMSHTWIGDLIFTVQYDMDCDGDVDAEAHPLCRHQLTGCPVDNCCGCSGNLSGMYMFDDDESSIENVCPTTFAPGCYGPDFDGNMLSAFDGLPKGGCFWFLLQDGAGGDTGTVSAISVHLLNEGGTPTEKTSWSQIKAIY